ncbi:class I SAM-dependent methyltransferase [Undibacterium umbellatum]|uniref:Class I SAM-dependent methyltransferase n=1 Tax=Undibacterium umbellatum TaxID=2762300 RepID=A0ABR6ZBP2_9BURK|nr:class I SAM-dependent methyltransferase [Undibacterium umbellatum]MBC3909169.1 class I SAM-dependent methyltransferase [Undibacterium umbellatum]
MKCRHCDHELTKPFLDLGSAPPSNAYLRTDTLENPEVWLPLKLMVCDACWLAQTLDFTGRENLFDADYAYFSSFSSSWLKHAEQFVAAMRQELALNEHSLVVEVAANDGYLLQYVKAAGIPCLGVEPTTSTANAARAKGIPVIENFFGTNLAQELKANQQSADLTVANNVLAHVPDINDFVAGFSALLKPQGVASFEFPHLLNMVQENQFDTAYHEHYSYLSLHAVQAIFEKNGLQVFDVQEWPTHGGSLRVLAQRSDTGLRNQRDSVVAMLKKESAAGITDVSFYQSAQKQAEKAKFELLEFLLNCKKEEKTVVGYGAAAKGNTLLNFSGIRPDLLTYVVDINVHKQGKYMPGSRIPILTETELVADKPDYVLILPWNLRQEIEGQLSYIRAWGGKFVTAIPTLSVF